MTPASEMDYYLYLGPNPVCDLRLSARERWYFDRHCERYRSRYDVGALDYPPRGVLGTFQGVSFTSTERHRGER